MGRDPDYYGAALTGLGPYPSEETNFDGAYLVLADLDDAVCGTPTYIVANGASLTGVQQVPTSRKPVLWARLRTVRREGTATSVGGVGRPGRALDEPGRPPGTPATRS